MAEVHQTNWADDDDDDSEDGQFGLEAAKAEAEYTPSTQIVSHSTIVLLLFKFKLAKNE